MDAKCCDKRVRLYVCLLTYLKNARPKFRNFLYMLTLAVIGLRRNCNKLYTSGLVYDVTFADNRPGKGVGCILKVRVSK